MKVIITIDVDAQETGYRDNDELKDNIVDFARSLIFNGVIDEEIACTLLEVDYI